MKERISVSRGSTEKSVGCERQERCCGCCCCRLEVNIDRWQETRNGQMPSSRREWSVAGGRGGSLHRADEAYQEGKRTSVEEWTRSTPSHPSCNMGTEHHQIMPLRFPISSTHLPSNYLLLHPLATRISHIRFLVKSHSSLSSCAPSFATTEQILPLDVMELRFGRCTGGQHDRNARGASADAPHACMAKLRRCERCSRHKGSFDCSKEVLMSDPSTADDRLACSVPRPTGSPLLDFSTPIGQGLLCRWFRNSPGCFGISCLTCTGSQTNLKTKLQHNQRPAGYAISTG